MAIQLYKHNADAYAAIEHMLRHEERAAIVHPTGTGKSTIAFRLAQEHSHQRFLWLSPSDRSACTLLKNALAADPSADFSHVSFMTYARLTYLSDDEIDLLKPDYIILDEFHRCGADSWGESVQRLLEKHARAKVIGLSAAKIRYLDHRRNRVNELFDGHIVSEMTLGEAMVRGILPAPIYVTTVCQYQKSLESYEERVCRLTRKQGGERRERYLRALRRSLERADGLNKVFEKYVKDCRSRYILFCTNISHMMEVHAHIREWFGNIDPSPHCYLVQSENMEADAAYEAFCRDESNHLKLLLCINMLNEGVHVRDAAGVIWFRPTVSPIIDKQQIGRALVASSNQRPLILDIVNNIESLHNISSIQQEMQVAVNRLRSNGLDDLIVQERLEVIDQARDCRKLFEKLEGSLHINWEEYYQAAVDYREAFGDLLVPQHYVTNDGKCLGSWVQTQRNIRNGSKGGFLTEDQIIRLERIGMVWDIFESRWQQNFSAAKIFDQTNRHLYVPADYRAEDGLARGAWINNQRSLYRRHAVGTLNRQCIGFAG